MRFISAVHTDIGIKKNTNQDSALIMEANTSVGNVLLSVVCDGMGGLAKGEVASSTVISAFAKWFEEELPYTLTLENMQDRLFSSWEKIIFSCNDRIARYAGQLNCAMGTTLVAVLFAMGKTYIVNVGDTRLYQVTDSLYQLTKDQSYVQREMDAGRMTVEEAMVSPQRNVLLQCIGASEVIVPDFMVGEYGQNQVFIICTDGFRHVISPQEIYDYCNPNVIHSEKNMIDGAVYLTDLNKCRRETDNITALLVKIE